LGLFSFGGYGLALAALALMVFGAIECPPSFTLVFPGTRSKTAPEDVKSVLPWSRTEVLKKFCTTPWFYNVALIGERERQYPSSGVFERSRVKVPYGMYMRHFAMASLKRDGGKYYQPLK